jgi:hypothetical protein
MVNGEYQLVNLLVRRERKRDKDVSHSQSFAKQVRVTGISLAVLWSAAALRCFL